VQIFKSKRKRLYLGSAPPPSTIADDLLRRHQNQNSDERHGDPLDAEVRLLTTLVLVSDVDQLTWEIYIAFRSGYTYAEIAAAWDVSNFTIKKCIARALLALMET
jgi:hypothetical protein